MFRYLGFTWDPAHAAQAAFAQRLEESIRRTAGWQTALSSTGLRVLATGPRPGVNGIYRLLSDQGVILGRLFHRHGGPAGTRDIQISAGDSERILQTNGRALIDDYWGRYVAIFRSRRRGTQVLRDPSGTLPCYRVDIEGVHIVFSWLDDLIAFTPSWPVPRVNWDAIAALISIGRLGGHRTALEGVTEILPGQSATLDQAPHSTTSLWSAVASARASLDLDPNVAAARLRQVVTDCVRTWSSCYATMLLRLSGGLDSAILLGSLTAGTAAAQITCLNYHGADSDSDERKFARLAAASAGVKLVERELDGDFRLDKVLAVGRTPTPESYVGRLDTSRTDADIAATHGAGAMFTGAGGDQLFFERRCTWPAADYLGTHGPGRGFLAASLDAARLGRVSLWESMRRAVADQRHRTSPLRGMGQYFTLARREELDGVPLDEYVHPDLLSASDLPVGKFHHLQDLINPFGYYDPYLREAAPELVNPLMSQPLIELCLALPTWLLTHGGRGRALARRAFAPELPKEIAARQSKGGSHEHLTKVLLRNLPLVRALLIDGQLVRHGLLDRSKVEAALGGRPSSLRGHLGEIHFHFAIEAWLLRFATPANR